MIMLKNPYFRNVLNPVRPTQQTLLENFLQIWRLYAKYHRLLLFIFKKEMTTNTLISVPIIIVTRYEDDSKILQISTEYVNTTLFL